MLLEREGVAFFDRRDLVGVAFDFELMSANAGGFIPVEFCSTDCPRHLWPFNKMLPLP